MPSHLVRYRFAASCLGLAGALVAGGSIPAHAQEPADAAAEAQSDAVPANAIIVTAQRREENLQDVPVSLTVVSDDMLESRNINDVADLGLVAPGLQVAQGDRFAIRGVGTVAFSETLESSVTTSVDEVNQGRSFGGGALFNDIARIEVLSGPQGLLFGKNASAGLINIITRRPDTSFLEGRSSVEFVSRPDRPDARGSSHGVVAKTALNVPLSDNVATRVDGYYSYQEPVTQFVGTGDIMEEARAYGGRAKLLIEAGDLELYFIGDYNVRKGAAGFFERSVLSLGAGSGIAAPIAALGIVPGPENFLVAADGDIIYDVEGGGVQGQISYGFENGWEVSNIAAWRFSNKLQQIDTDFTNSNNLSLNRRDSEYDQYTNELRITLPAESRFSGQFGLYYFQSDLAADSLLAGFLGAPGPLPASDFRVGSDSVYDLSEKSYAAFGQFDFDITDSLEVLAGLRVNREELNFQSAQNVRFIYRPVRLGVINPAIDQSFEDTKVSWKFGAQYEVNPDIMVYGFYGRGYKGAGFNDRQTQVNQNLAVEPEEATTLEGGVKSAWFDGDLIFNLSGYYTKFKNYQLQALDTAQQTFQILNAGEVTTKGLELQVFAELLPGLSINASGTLQEATFDDFPGAECTPDQLQPCTDPIARTFNAAGTSLPNAPTFAGTIQGMYEGRLTDDLDFFLESNFYHRSSVNYRTGEPPSTRQGPVDILGASIGVTADEFTVRLFCRNCTNEITPTLLGVLAGDANNGITTSTQQFGLNSVRNIGLSLEMQY